MVKMNWLEKKKKKLGNKNFSKNVYFVYNTKFIQDGNKMTLLNKIQWQCNWQPNSSSPVTEF